MLFYRILKSPEADGEGSLRADAGRETGALEDAVMAARGEPEASRVNGNIEANSRSRLAELEALLRAQEASHAREIAALERRASELERAYRGALLDRELITVLADKPLIPGAAAQLIKLWRDELEVHDEGGERRVSARDGRPVAQVVNDWLASPEFAHFLRPSARGGTAARGTNRPSAPLAVSAPRNLGEVALQRWRESASQRGEGPAPTPGWGRLRRN
jgi:hypothetical protein